MELERDPLLEQERLLPFLSDPASYPHRPASVRLIQTHASLVFLAPPFVYKIKKAVDFGFLDFSTLEKRRTFCERELELNRRLTHDVYLDVALISAANGGFTFGEGETVVEYAVKMRVLPEEGFLHRRLARGDLGELDLDRIAAALKGFYTSQPRNPAISEYGRVQAIKAITDGNFDVTKEFVGRTLSSAAYDALRTFTESFYTHRSALFDQRVREGRILDCHGDLHLDHVHLTPEALNIYDCIEFNDRFRYIDVANDAAFLAMDLDFHGRPDLARYFVERMTAELDDPGMSRVMDFYKCSRAFVRGEVESLHSVAHAAPAAEREASADKARRYFRLALRYAVADSKPFVLAVMGRIASGKSTLARVLGEELGWDVLSSDNVRKTLAGLPLHERPSGDVREALYTSSASKMTYETLFEKAETSVRARQGIVLDATFGRREFRDSLRERLKKLEADYCFVECRASDPVIRDRLARRESESHVVSDARLEDFALLTGPFEPPVELLPDRVVAVDTSGTVDDSLADALRFLVERRVAAS